MVHALQQYFIDNDGLQQDELDEFISDLMNYEFDTLVDDGSLPQVAQQVCEMFQQCQQDRLTEVREQIKQMIQKKSAEREQRPHLLKHLLMMMIVKMKSFFLRLWSVMEGQAELQSTLKR